MSAFTWEACWTCVWQQQTFHCTSHRNTQSPLPVQENRKTTGGTQDRPNSSTESTLLLAAREAPPNSSYIYHSNCLQHDLTKRAFAKRTANNLTTYSLIQVESLLQVSCRPVNWVQPASREERQSCRFPGLSCTHRLFFVSNNFWWRVIFQEAFSPAFKISTFFLKTYSHLNFVKDVLHQNREVWTNCKSITMLKSYNLEQISLQPFSSSEAKWHNYNPRPLNNPEICSF